MANKTFQFFSELISFRSKCPLCSKNLTYKVSTDLYDDKAITLEALFDKSLGNPKELKFKTISTTFKSTRKTPLKIKKLNISLDLINNLVTGDWNTFDKDIIFEFSIYCHHNNAIGNAYEARGSFGFHEGYYEKETNLFSIERFISQIILNWELYKIIDVQLENLSPYGSVIKILNQFNYEPTTSFSIAETNLDGTHGSFVEKRIPYVGDDYFKFNEPAKVYSRISSLLLMANK
jgi:hypothetical protein